MVHCLECEHSCQTGLSSNKLLCRHQGCICDIVYVLYVTYTTLVDIAGRERGFSREISGNTTFVIGNIYLYCSPTIAETTKIV